MITPRFSCSQTVESVIISIYCPSVRASDVEINVDDTLFSVHINPYFLRLNFTHSLVEDDESSAQYDPGTGYLTVTLTKAIKGQEFQDLDLLAKLLAPRPSVQQPVIEVISSEDAVESAEDDDLVTRTQELSLDQREILSAAQNDWQLPQRVATEDPIRLAAHIPYGFLNSHSGYFTNITYTENEVNELGSSAESCPVSDRRQKRIRHENEKWDEEYYMADFADDAFVQELLHWEHPHTVNSNAFEYTEKETAAMLNLPRREYLSTPAQTHNLYLTLLTLLFSYAYDARTTQQDPTTESAWTISTLTPAFSALDPPSYEPSSTISQHVPSFSKEEILATFIPSYRRVLAFPLHRSFALAERCRLDVALLLSKGKRVVFRCLLEMKDIIDHHEVYYVYSKIWIDDFCVWTQVHVSDDVLSDLSILIKETEVEKQLIGWDLEELEAVVRQVQNNEGREVDSDDESDEDASPAPL